MVLRMFANHFLTDSIQIECNETCSIADEFYSLFYLGLFCESRGEPAKAASYMKHAAKTEYATGKGRADYMTSCARIHCQLRGWS